MATHTVNSTPGYWCECVVNDKRLGSFDAYSPQQALRWVRVSLMMIAMSLDEQPYREARDWTTHGQEDALHALHNGQPQSFTLTHQSIEITWTTRPVIFLPLAHRQAEELPACAERFPETQHYPATE